MDWRSAMVCTIGCTCRTWQKAVHACSGKTFSPSLVCCRAELHTVATATLGRLQSQAAKPEAIVTGQSRRVQVEPQLTMTSRTATVDKPNESRNSAH